MNPDQRPNLPLNGATPKRPSLPRPSLTPEERRIWLASHNAPRDMMLIAIPEFAQMMQGIANGNRALMALRRTVDATASVLDGYARTQPDLPTAAGEAVHDANRHRVAATNAEAALDYVLTALQTLANATDGGCDDREAETLVGPVIQDAANRVGESLRVVKEQLALRYDPFAKDKPEGAANG